jgi:alanine racemase
LAAAVSRERGLGLGGIFTHFPVADSEAADDLAFTRAQIETFRGVAEELARAGLKPAFASAANSGAVLLHPDSWMDMVRPGILVYGYPPVSVAGFSEDIRPVMEFLTCIVFMKRVQAGSPVSYGRTWSAPVSTVIATLPAGYADGYPRALSNRAEVWVGGRRRPVAGRVCMDQLMVDLGPEGGASLHDDVVLFGPGAGVPGADELAAIAGTIPYEITCGINKRVPRVYEGGGLSA